MSTETTHLPLDEPAADALAHRGLTYRLVGTDDEQFPAYTQAVGRGFLGGESSDERVEGARAFHAAHRQVGVYDPRGARPDSPVATVVSWPARMTMPGARETPVWAISGVTVAVTHRRQGLARCLLEGELRAAHAAGIPVAGLTVSEATIYGRFGFGPATFAADWTIDTRRVRWSGPMPPVRLDYIDRAAAADDLTELHERTRLARPGEIDAPAAMWSRLAGIGRGVDGGDKIRAVRCSDAGGRMIGVVLFRLTEDESDYTAHTLDVLHLIADGDDAYAALWRMLVTHDLVTRVRASLRTADEPLRWMLGDQRAATVSLTEHEWLRVLDTPAALTARSYSAPLRLSLVVDDPLGLAAGTWLLSVDGDGTAHVEPCSEPADARLPVASLGAMLVGGASPLILRAAGLLQADADTALTLERAFWSPQPPQLSFWY